MAELGQQIGQPLGMGLGLFPFAVGGAAVSIGFVQSHSELATSTTDVTVDMSGWGLLENDIVIVFVSECNAGTSSVAMVSAGWTQIGSDLYGDDTYDNTSAAYYKIMGATPDTSFTVDGRDGSSEPSAVIAYAFRGVDTVSPLDVTPTTLAAANGGNPTPPAITTVTDGCVILCHGSGSGSSMTTAPTPGANLPNNVETQTEDLGSLALGSGAAWARQSVAGTFTPDTWTGGNSSTASGRTAFTIALRPDQGATTLEQLTALTAGTNSAIWIPLSGYSDLYSDSGRTTPITAGSGDPVGAVDDLSGNGLHLLQATTSLKPDATDGLTLDGVDDNLDATFTVTGDAAFLALVKTTDTLARPLSAVATSGYPADWQNGSTSTTWSSPASDIHVDGTLFTAGVSTSDAVHDAIATGTWKTFENRVIDWSVQDGVRVGKAFNGFRQYAGAVGALVFLDLAGLGANAASALSLAQTLMAEIKATL